MLVLHASVLRSRSIWVNVNHCVSSTFFFHNSRVEEGTVGRSALPHQMGDVRLVCGGGSGGGGSGGGGGRMDIN